MLGAAWPLLRDPLAYLRDAYASLGPIFEVGAAHRSFVVLAGKQANRFIAGAGRGALRSDGFWGRFAAHRQCPHLMIAMDGPDHLALRKLYKDDLTRAVVDARREDVAAVTLEQLDHAADGGDFGVLDVVRRLVSRQVHDLLSHGAPPPPDEATEAVRESFRWETNALLLGKWPELALRLPQYRRHAQRSEALLEELVASAREDPPAGWFAHTLQGAETMPELFTEGDIRGGFLLPFVAGVDTVGATLGFLLHEVLGDPELLARLVAAVDPLFEDGVPTYSALKGTPVLHATVREALRLYPAAFGVYRRAGSTFRFADHEVAEGRDVLVFTTSTHTDPQYFADPLRFDVDRFLPPREEHKQSAVFAPFGGGPHVCLGAGMGMAQLLLGLALVVRHFEGEVVAPDGPLRPFYDPSLSPPPELRIRLSRR